MSKVPTQNSVQEIADNLSVVEGSSKAIANTASAVVKIIERVDVKQIKNGDKKMNIIGKMMSSYVTALCEIITSLDNVTPEGKTLDKILGKIEDEKKSDGTVTKVTKWTNLDALLNISPMMNGLIKGITANDQISKSSMFAKKKLEKDIKTSISLAMFAFTSMIDELMKIQDSDKLTKLMELLVDGPEIVTEHMTRRDDSKKMEKQELVKIQENTDKITKKGKVGLINALKNIFDLLKMMLELEPPGIIGMVLFKKKIKDFGQMMIMTIEEFTKLLNSIGTDELLKTSVMSCKVISGTGKEGEDGILGVITNMFSIIDIINDISVVKLKITNKTIDEIQKLFNKLINNIVELFIDSKSFKPKKEVETLISKDLTEMLEKMKDQLNLIKDIFVEFNATSGKIILCALISTVAIPSIFIVQLFLICFSKLISKLQTVFENVDFDKLDTLTDNISTINSILKQLVFTELLMLVLGLLAIRAALSSLTSILFIASLVLFVKVLDKAFDVIAKIINRDMKNDIKEFVSTLLSLVKIQGAIILMAILSKAAIISMIIVAIFVVALIPFIAIVDWVFDVIAKIINKDVKMDIKEFALTLVSLVLIQLSIILIAQLAEVTIKAMIISIIFLAVLAVFVWVVGLVFDVIAKIINRDYKNDMRELALTLLLLVAIQITVIVMAWLTPLAIKSMIISLAFLVSMLIFILVLWVVLKITDKLIKAKTYMALLEVLTIVVILFALEVMMIIMGSIAVKAMVCTLLALVFVIVLMVFIALVGALCYLLVTYGSMLTGPAIAGLGIILVITALLVAVGALLIVLGNMWDSLNVGGLLGVLGTMLLAIVLEIAIGVLGLGAVIGIAGVTFVIIVSALLLAAASIMAQIQKCNVDMGIMGILGVISLAILAIVGIGMLGLTAIIALAFMPMNIALVGMFYPIAQKINEIGQYELDEDAIKKKIDICKSILDYIKESFGDIVIFEGKTTMRAKLNIYTGVSLLNNIRGLIFKLGFIGKLKIDSERAIKNVELSITTVYKIEEAINTLTKIPTNEDGSINTKGLINEILGDAIQGMMAKKKFNRADRILAQIFSIVKKLNAIQEFTINYDKISNTLESILGEKGVITKIEEFINKKNALPDNWTYKDVINMWKQNVEDNLNYRAQNRMMNRSDKILTQIHTIVKTLDEINKFSVNKDNITSKLEKIFDVIDWVDKYVAQRNAMTEEEKEELIRRMRLNSFFNTDLFTDPEEMIKMAEAANIDRTTKIIVGIGDMTRSLKDIMEIKVTPDAAQKKVTNILNCIDQIYTEIETRTKNKTAWFSDGTDKTVNKICEEINVLNESLRGLSGITDSEVKNSKAALDNYSKFLTKVDTLKVENLEKSASMFEQMARFSESITGNFDKLAESLSDEIMPLLKELKDTMEQANKSLESGFSSTTETLMATSPVPVSSDNMNSVVKANNPNMTPEQQQAEATRRMAAQMRNQNNTLAAKLDEMISLLSGSGRIRTIME